MIKRSYASVDGLSVFLNLYWQPEVKEERFPGKGGSEGGLFILFSVFT